MRALVTLSLQIPVRAAGEDMSLIYPVDPKQLPKELLGVEWPPKA
jgi:hypothetical protein